MSIEPLRPFEDHAERLPPHNEEAEDAVLGSVLLDREVLGRIAGIVAPEDFYRDRHALVYAAMLALHERQEPIDYLLLLDELERSGRLAQVGGATALSSRTWMAYKRRMSAVTTRRRSWTASRPDWSTSTSCWAAGCSAPIS
jgi:hypothetical protein